MRRNRFNAMRSTPGGTAVIVLAVLAVLATTFLTSCSGGGGNRKPRLVVLLVVDQMRPDHIDRFEDLYTGGLARLLEGSAVFTSCFHDHAGTYTSPGHASIVTGTHPSRHGVVGNRWYGRDRMSADPTGDDRFHDSPAGSRPPTVSSAADETCHLLENEDATGSSAHNLLVDAIGDWLKTASPASKVYSVAIKNYAAALMGGHDPDGVFWYNRERGTFCTSTNYAAEYPDWAWKFNESRRVDKYFDTVWTRKMPDSVYARSRRDAFAGENDGEKTTFPYELNGGASEPNRDFYGFLRRTPFGDELTLAFAREMIDGAELGADKTTDLLMVGLSAADFIGHIWGPESQEAQDYYLRLDDYLDEFLAFLDERVGAGNTTVVLTSDHGCLSLPGYLAERGVDARRIPVTELETALAGVDSTLRMELGFGDPLIVDWRQGILLDYAEATRNGFRESDLRRRVADALREFDFIADVFTREELAGAGADRPYLREFRNSYHPDRAPDLEVLLARNRFVATHGPTGTTHGSPYEYDRHVPLIMWGAGIAPGAYDEPVASVDVAPTLARLLEIPPKATPDGRALMEALNR